jgi:hypothetical protein
LRNTKLGMNEAKILHSLRNICMRTGTKHNGKTSLGQEKPTECKRSYNSICRKLPPTERTLSCKTVLEDYNREKEIKYNIQKLIYEKD